MPEPEKTLVGKQGEFIILANLSEMGISAYHIDAADTDIVCISHTERPIRIQVKSMVSNIGETFRVRKRHNHYYDKNSFEIVACVILDTKEIYYLNFKAIKSIYGDGGSVTVKKLRQFTYGLTVEECWNKAVKKYYPGFLIEERKDESYLSRLNGNGSDSGKRSEGQLQQGVLF